MSDVYTRERELQREIAQRVEPAIPGVEVLAVELGGPERFCVYVDHPQGVDHALCERVTTVLRPYLQEYAVDVSSPGVERPLRKRGHFQGAVGRRAQLRTSRPVEGRTRFRGEVAAAGDQAVTLDLDGTTIDVPYDAIVRGNLVYEG